MTASDVAQLPLEGLRVVDLSDERGVLAARLLADLGADVIRAEDRNWATGDGPTGPRTLAWAVRNANKRIVSVDPADAADRQALLHLVETADLLIDGGAPSPLLGVPVEELRARCPQLVVVSVTDYGLTGPYAGYAGTSAVLAGLGWMLYKAGTPDLPPVLPPGWLVYDIAGISAAYAAMTALHHRRRRGAGQHLDVSVMEAAQQTTDWSLPNSVYLQGLGIATNDVRWR